MVFTVPTCYLEHSFSNIVLYKHGHIEVFHFSLCGRRDWFFLIRIALKPIRNIIYSSCYTVYGKINVTWIYINTTTYYLRYLLKITVITSIMQTWPLRQLYTIIELISLYNMVARNVGQLSWKIKLKCQPGGLIPFPNCSPSLQLDLAFDTLLILQKTIPENVQLKYPDVHLI